jgi:hypothetical protein
MASAASLARPKKGRCCPVIDGSRERRLEGLNKMAEIGVLLVAILIITEVRSGVIPWGCPIAQKQACLQTWSPDPSFLPGSCDDARSQCFSAVGMFGRDVTVTQAGLPASYNATFGYCQCLVYSQMQSNGSPRPGYCVFSNIFSILIFVLGAALVLVSELLLKRKVTAWIVWMSCEFYFVASLVIVGAIGWGGLCQGIMYEQVFSILTALIIGQCIFFLVAFVIMMLAAAKLAPNPWILYDVEDYEQEKKEKRSRARSQNGGLTASGQRAIVHGQTHKNGEEEIEL